MAAPSNSQLAFQMSNLIDRWRQYTDQMKDWLAGAANGGPSGDGKYPLTDAAGVTYMVLCPAAQESMVNTTVVSAGSYADDADASAVAAQSAATAATTAKNIANTFATAAQAARDLAQTYANAAGTHAANALVYRNEALAARDTTNTASTAAVQAAVDADADRIAADEARIAAQAAAAQAATFDPSSFYTKTTSDGRFRLQSTAITYSELSGKPSTFTPSAHSHVIGDVTGLQTALNGKAASATTAAGYGILDVYTKTQVDTGLAGKVSSSFFSGDMNTLKTDGHYRVANNTNLPAGAFYGHVIVSRGTGTDTTTQIALGYTGNDIWYRGSSDAGGWTTWKQVYHSGNFDPNSKLGVSAKAADSDLIDGIDSSRLVYGVNGSGTISQNDMNAPTKSGFYESGSGTNGPVGTWNWYIHHEHTGLNGHGFQLSNVIGTNNLYLRSRSGGVYTAWATLARTDNPTFVGSLNMSSSAPVTFYNSNYRILASTGLEFHTNDTFRWVRQGVALANINDYGTFTAANLASSNGGGAYFGGNGSGTQHNGSLYLAGNTYKLSAGSDEWLIDYRMKVMTAAAYAALGTKDPNTLYLVY